MASKNPQQKRKKRKAKSNPYRSPARLQAKQSTPAKPAPVTPAKLQLTRNGLLSIYYGILILLLFFCAAVLAMLINSVTAIQIELTSRTTTITMALVAISAYLLIAAGHLLCLTVPAGTGAKRFIQFGVAMHVIALVLYVVNLAGQPVGEVDLATDPNTTDQYGTFTLQLITGVPTFAGTLGFLLFAQKLAVHLGEETITRNSKTALVLVTIGFGMSLFAPKIAPLVSRTNSMLAGMAYLGALIAVTVLAFTRSVDLTRSLAKAIRTA